MIIFQQPLSSGLLAVVELCGVPLWALARGSGYVRSPIRRLPIARHHYYFEDTSAAWSVLCMTGRLHSRLCLFYGRGPSRHAAQALRDFFVQCCVHFERHVSERQVLTVELKRLRSLEMLKLMIHARICADSLLATPAAASKVCLLSSATIRHAVGISLMMRP